MSTLFLKKYLRPGCGKHWFQIARESQNTSGNVFAVFEQQHLDECMPVHSRLRTGFVETVDDRFREIDIDLVSIAGGKLFATASLRFTQLGLALFFAVRIRGGSHYPKNERQVDYCQQSDSPTSKLKNLWNQNILPEISCWLRINSPFRINYSFSNPWLVNFKVRLFSVTVRTTLSGAPSGILASISMVTVTLAPTRPDR